MHLQVTDSVWEEDNCWNMITDLKHVKIIKIIFIIIEGERGTVWFIASD